MDPQGNILFTSAQGGITSGDEDGGLRLTHSRAGCFLWTVEDPVMPVHGGPGMKMETYRIIASSGTATLQGKTRTMSC